MGIPVILSSSLNLDKRWRELVLMVHTQRLNYSGGQGKRATNSTVILVTVNFKVNSRLLTQLSEMMS